MLLPDVNYGKFLWVLDSGHGEATKGKESPVWSDGTQLKEYAFNREMTRLLMYHAPEFKLKMATIDEGDFDIGLPRRVRKIHEIKERRPKRVISNHANGWGKDHLVHGVEVFTSKGATEADVVAEYICKELFSIKSVNARYDITDGDLDKEAHFYILRETKPPAVLIEYGFMTNENECKLLMSESYRLTLAYSVLTALKKYEDSK